MGTEFDTKYLSGFIEDEDLNGIESEVKSAHDILYSGTFRSATGWLDLPENYDINEFNRVKQCADKIRNDSDILIVIGIGGSYLGARAAIEFLHSSNYNFLGKDTPNIFFAGNNMSSSYIGEILDMCKDKDVSLNVVSKSGTTTEPAIAFRIFKNFMEDKYGKAEAKNRIYCTTDKNKGKLKELAIKEGYEIFAIPDDIGGRFSVLSSVGLLPIAVSGADIDRIMFGALKARNQFMKCSLEENDCYKYAAVRNILYRKGKSIEILTAYEPRLSIFLEWWKQLYGESEGKNHKGLFPASAIFTTDLHSMGQFIQDGSRIMFETNLIIKNSRSHIVISKDKNDSDGLNYMSGKTLEQVNRTAFKATVLAHCDGGVPNGIVRIKDSSEEELGSLIYFFEKSCAISGLILGVNPFNQPGVEAYKNNMFALLERPGYEGLKNKLCGNLSD